MCYYILLIQLSLFKMQSSCCCFPVVYKWQSYDWGKIGGNSLVYELSHKAGLMTEEQPKSPFAELWIGDHPPIPSSIKNPEGDQVNLRDLIDQDPERFLGKAYPQFGKKELPLLFKVLSVNKALSLQVHPDKALARELNEKSPDIYKDNNHKPEIAIAISEFEALCNFRPYEEIVEAFREVAPLRDFVGDEVISKFQSCQETERTERLRDILREIFKREKDVVNQTTAKLVDLISQKQVKSKRDQLVLRIHQQFPFDVGLLISYLLNYLTIQPGEAFIMDPCEPHAYLYGNCIEVMSASDNVIRGCLTPKYIDKDVLCRALSCKMHKTKVHEGELLNTPEKDGYEFVKYPTPYEEFVCFRLHFHQRNKQSNPIIHSYPVLALVLKGKGKAQTKASNEAEYEEYNINEGESVFFLPNTPIKFESCEEGFVLYLCTSQSFSNE